MVSVWLALAVVLSLDQWCSPLVGGVPTEDPGRYLTVAQGWMEGLMPYRDLFDHKGPLVYVFHLFALFGGGGTALWSLCLLCVLLTTCLAYKLCRLFAQPREAFLAACFIPLMLCAKADNNDSPELMAMPLVGVATLALLPALRRGALPSLRAVAVAALGVSLVALLKPNCAAAPAALLLLTVLLLLRHFQPGSLARYAAAALLPVALVAVAVWALLAQCQCFEQYLDAAWRFNFEYSAQWSLERLLRFGKVAFGYLFPFHVALAYVLVSEWRGPDRWLWLALAAWFYFTLAFNVGLTLYAWYIHVMPTLLVGVLFVARALDRLSVGLKPVAVLACAMIAAMLVARHVLPRQVDENKDVNTRSIAHYIEQHSQPGDQLVVYKSSLPILLYTERRSASRLFYQTPIFGIRGSLRDEFLADLRRNSPRFIVLGGGVPTSDLPNDIMAHYELAATFAPLNVYHRKP